MTTFTYTLIYIGILVLIMIFGIRKISKLELRKVMRVHKEDKKLIKSLDTIQTKITIFNQHTYTKINPKTYKVVFTGNEVVPKDDIARGVKLTFTIEQVDRIFREMDEFGFVEMIIRENQNEGVFFMKSNVLILATELIKELRKDNLTTK